jgi:hypothetical protein
LFRKQNVAQEAGGSKEAGGNRQEAARRQEVGHKREQGRIEAGCRRGQGAGPTRLT